jgi:FtsP/CotA-like multicopper oxidase with cupredoxin domain
LTTPEEVDTIVISPGQTIDGLVTANQLGVWAFHCHVLNHAEGPEGMFGMVTAFIVTK